MLNRTMHSIQQGYILILFELPFKADRFWQVYCFYQLQMQACKTLERDNSVYLIDHSSVSIDVHNELQVLNETSQMQ